MCMIQLACDAATTAGALDHLVTVSRFISLGAWGLKTWSKYVPRPTEYRGVHLFKHALLISAIRYMLDIKLFGSLGGGRPGKQDSASFVEISNIGKAGEIFL